MSIETLIALTDLYGFTMDSLIYGKTRGAGIWEQDKKLLENLETLPPQMQDTLRQMLALFVNGISGKEKADRDSVELYSE